MPLGKTAKHRAGNSVGNPDWARDREAVVIMATTWPGKRERRLKLMGQRAGFEEIIHLPPEGICEQRKRIADECLAKATEWDAPKEVIDWLCRWRAGLGI
jgi:hypothetical protein